MSSPMTIRSRRIDVAAEALQVSLAEVESCCHRSKFAREAHEDILKRVADGSFNEMLVRWPAEAVAIADRVGFETAELLSAPERPIRDYRVA